MDHYDKERQQYNMLQEKMKQDEKTYHDQVASLSVQLNEVTKQSKHLEESNSELRLKVSSLQKELSTGEAVQQDFVRLSQTLQVIIQSFNINSV